MQAWSGAARSKENAGTGTFMVSLTGKHTCVEAFEVANANYSPQLAPHRSRTFKLSTDLSKLRFRASGVSFGGSS